ncbi:MAG: CHAT domain-containing protein, partial [Candidatus Solibacter usitatus]|nr:CHAT domain-containing protein [Candidatus Solibacter usitatus]
IDVFRRTVGPSHPYYLQAQALRAQILARLGRTAAAFGESVAAARQWTEHIRLTAQSMAERQALTYGLSDQLTAAELATALALDQPELGGAARREVWDHWIRARALVLDEMTARQRLVGRDADPELARLHWGLVDERRRLARLVLSAGGENTAERIAEAMRRKDRLERDLGDRSVTLRRDLRRGQIGFADVAAQLPPRSALVAFVRFRRDVPAAPKRAWVAAFVLLSGEEEPVLLPVAEESELEALVRDWRSRIAMAASDPLRAGKRAEALMRATGERLRRKIWDPLALYLGRAERVFLVPEGALHLVNFAALPTGTDRYLIESGPLLHTLSAERDLVPPESLRRGSNLLALANPAFSGPSPRRPPGAALRGATPACADLRQVRFGPLPATAGEVREIARLWPDANPTVLSGAQASETEFRAQAPGKRIVHVATHGFFQGEQCGASRLVGEAAGQSPLVFSGLALAGANRRQTAKEDEEDGMLTAEEIAGLDLEGVEWVVLSGCDTGLGQIRSRDGVFGMRRAFQTAGAATVIMSLWPVEDRAARDWMRALYANRLSRRLSTAEALREAGRSALQARRQSGRSTHPFFWAAFVGAGDWR